MKNEKNLLRIEDVSVGFKQIRKFVEILSSINLTCKIHEIIAIIGKSGSGKTTLLKTIAGLIQPNSGKIYLNDKQISGPSRERGLVFQQYCVFPWLTVRGNIELGSKCGLDTRPEVLSSEIEHLLEATGLTEHQHKWPSQLSGGMQQRVAIARTLAVDPQLLLLDEPFGALDAITRLQMQQLIQSIFKTIKQGILLVTHDIREAVLLADKVALLSGSPATIEELWKVPLPRSSSNPLKLPIEQEKLVNNIFSLLYQNDM